VDCSVDIFSACCLLCPEMDDRTCYRDTGSMALQPRFELFRRIWCGFLGRRHGILKTVGYENASYGHSAERKGNIEAGFRRED